MVLTCDGCYQWFQRPEGLTWHLVTSTCGQPNVAHVWKGQQHREKMKNIPENHKVALKQAAEALWWVGPWALHPSCGTLTIWHLCPPPITHSKAGCKVKIAKKTVDLYPWWSQHCGIWPQQCYRYCRCTRQSGAWPSRIKAINWLRIWNRAWGYGLWARRTHGCMLTITKICKVPGCSARTCWTIGRYVIMFISPYNLLIILKSQSMRLRSPSDWACTWHGSKNASCIPLTTHFMFFMNIQWPSQTWLWWSQTHLQAASQTLQHHQQLPQPLHYHLINTPMVHVWTGQPSFSVIGSGYLEIRSQRSTANIQLQFWTPLAFILLIFSWPISQSWMKLLLALWTSAH